MFLQSKIMWMAFITAFLFTVNDGEKEVYQRRKQIFSLDRPKITSCDREYFENVTIGTRRVSRSDFNHYINVSGYVQKALNNTSKTHFYFYQLLSNVYKPSFVELHFGLCDMFESDNVINYMIRKAYDRMPISERPMPTLKCPIKPGFYRLYNMEVPTNYIPKNFPFAEGRLNLNATDGKKIICGFQIDFELKTGFYRLYNVEVPTNYIPKTFPFTEGRVILNATDGKKMIGSLHVDFELKTVRY